MSKQQPNSSYNKLKNIFKEIHIIRAIQSNLHWDMEVMMPEQAVDARGEQLAFLEEQVVHRITAQEVSEMLDQAVAEVAKLDQWEQANLRNMKRIYTNYIAVDGKLMAQYSEICNKSNAVWREARANNDWEMLTPYLEKVVDMVRKIAEQRADYLSMTPYNSLLNEFDPGRTSAEIDEHFSYLSKELPEILGARMETQQVKDRWPFLVPTEAQKKLGVEYMQEMGFNFSSGRLDTSTHPFCNGGWPDIRITSRYDESDPITALYGILHEAGHALYEQQLPRAWRDQPVGCAHGMSLHESQSLFVEKQIGRHPKFISHLSKRMKVVFNEFGDTVDEHWLQQYMLHVQPSFIRVDADEVTYPMHIIMRYNIEKRLFDGDIGVRDMPRLWNAYSQELLGIIPPDDVSGCLQDIHWPSGLFGYFPTYTLGAMNAAQLAKAMNKAMPHWRDQLADGRLKPVIEWLGTHVHAYASLFGTANELIEHATGEILNPRYFIEHLRSRYL
ncbi:MAG: carboxypeptidase M32 [Proteobacteria bacterium]|nr:carboxypeptidase M32 [Pseudomonadota bacterium]